MFTMKQAKVLVMGLLLGLSAPVAMAQDAAAPAPAADAAAAAGGEIAKGKEIWTNNCASCHNTNDQKMIGPGLGKIEERRNFEWIVKWVNNPAAMIKSDDYAKKLYEQYKPTVMAAYPGLSSGDIRSILDFVKSENVAKVVVAGPGANGGPSPAEGGNSGGMFEYILVGILALMILVLLALLSVVSSLSKKINPTTEQSSNSWNELMENLAKVGQNEVVKGGVITLFILLLGKVSIDAAFNVGVHQGYAPKQPIEFSHKLHAGEYKINCAYCHTGVYKTKGANIPSANICMNCHNAIKRDSPEIQKIYQAIEKDEPIQWVRVHNLPDLAYFNHAQHTNVGGLECQNCHGEIEKMEVVQQRSSLTMGWCIDCHRQTNVNAEGNAYYDKLVELHSKDHKGPMKVKDIGGLECSKCHY
jgi:mono/diheme cytochrome c family protein